MGNQSVTSLLSPVFLLMAFASAVSAQTVKASVDRDALHLGETVKFTIKWSGPNPESSVNLEALRKDFNVLGTSQSNQIKMFEGRTTITTELIITLEPKYAGTMEIPSIQVGRHRCI